MLLKKNSAIFGALKLGITYIFVLGLILGLYRYLPLSPILLTPNIVLSDWPRQPASCWDMELLDDKGVDCELESSKRNVILLGDSHAQQLVFGFEGVQLSPEYSESFNLIFLTSNLMTGNWRSPAYANSRQARFVHRFLSKLSANDVIVFSVTSGHLEDSVIGAIVDERRLQLDLSTLLENLFHGEARTAKLVLMLDTPHLKNNVARLCHDPGDVHLQLCHLDYDLYESQNARLLASYTEFVKSLGEDSPGVEIVDPSRVFCAERNCSLFNDSGFMLIDGNHVKASVSEEIVKGHLLHVL